MIPPAVHAWLHEDRRAFTLRLGTGPSAWSGTYDVATLDGWVKFYRGLRDRRAGQFRAFYEQQVVALEKLQRELRK